ncbi:protein GrpE [Nocardioides baekrokdamisoli]|uniref:Protein GrpE n=1 Tax=Nocardioides baekrokdamisoli TaxID=1804624 RepID=A0A3G9IEF4_9ACTN|nr:nucleotide exchange factor GrpE [Nocardioides baekrokdamisoli]BBH17287.1 protein GrpE [Nocardioides baekrokdamisoli]
MTDQPLNGEQPEEVAGVEETPAPQPESAYTLNVDPTDEPIPDTEVEVPVDTQSIDALLDARVAELTEDLQRLQAEYVNYKRRVDRDRDLIAENAAYRALSPIVEVLDTIDRAREHGDLGEDLKQVADQLERVVAAQGLAKFGEVGEPFDPTFHEALSHLGTDPDVEVTTIKLLAKSGYRIGDRVVRAAQVLVVDPE